MKKKLHSKIAFAVALVLVLSLTLAACGGGSGGGSSSDSGQSAPPESESTAPAEQEPADSGELPVADLSTVPTEKSDPKYAESAVNMPDLPTPTIVPVPDGVDPGKVWKLSMNDHLGDMTQQGQNEIQMMEHIKVRTNGQIDITPYFNATLVETGDIFTSVGQGGIADISIYNVDMNPGAQTKHIVFNLPMSVEALSNVEMSLVYRKFVADHPELDEENRAKGVTWISNYAVPANSFHTTGKDIKSPADFKGLKVIGNARLTDYLKTMGASGIVMGPGEWYTSLEKGVAEAQISHWPVVDDFGLLELYKSNTMLGSEYGAVSVLLQGWIANAEVWDSIPKAYQDVIIEEFDWAGMAASVYNDEFFPIMVQRAKDAGQNVFILTGDEAEAFYEVSRQANEVYYADAEKNGFTNARALHEELLTAIKNKDM